MGQDSGNARDPSSLGMTQDISALSLVLPSWFRVSKLDQYDRKLQRWKLAEVAYSLLEFCDPEEVAIHVSKFGISVYPRCDASPTTIWERMLWEQDRQLPAVWTGYLSRYLGLPGAVNKNNSPTSSRSLGSISDGATWPAPSPSKFFDNSVSHEAGLIHQMDCSRDRKCESGPYVCRHTGVCF